MIDVLTQYYGFITEFLDATLERYPPHVIIASDGIGHYEAWGSKGFDEGRTYPEYDEDPIDEVIFERLDSISMRTLDWIIKRMSREPFSSFVYSQPVGSNPEMVTFMCGYRISKIVRHGRDLHVHIIWDEPEEV